MAYNTVLKQLNPSSVRVTNYYGSIVILVWKNIFKSSTGTIEFN